jgi:CYTH domain-containing protein
LSAGRERELKLRLPSREAFVRLRDGPGWGTPSAPERQVSHYFDTVGHALALSRALVRIREGASRVLTFKHGEEQLPGFFDSVEIEAEVGEDVLAAALRDPESLLDVPTAPVAELRKRFGRPPLGWTGRLENERVRRSIEPGRATPAGTRPLILEIDRVVFPDGLEEHELEVELGEGDDPGAVQAWVLESLRAQGIAAEPERLTKLERLLRRTADRGGAAPS